MGSGTTVASPNITLLPPRTDPTPTPAKTSALEHPGGGGQPASPAAGGSSEVVSGPKFTAGLRVGGQREPNTLRRRGESLPLRVSQQGCCHIAGTGRHHTDVA